MGYPFDQDPENRVEELHLPLLHDVLPLEAGGALRREGGGAPRAGGGVRGVELDLAGRQSRLHLFVTLRGGGDDRDDPLRTVLDHRRIPRMVGGRSAGGEVGRGEDGEVGRTGGRHSGPSRRGRVEREE
jgi:hypothetical protein